MTELSEDLLFGASKVAQFIGVEPRAVYHWMDRRKSGKSAPPVFDVGGQVCGRRSELSSWFSGFRELSRSDAMPVNGYYAEIMPIPVKHGKVSSTPETQCSSMKKDNEQPAEVRE